MADHEAGTVAELETRSTDNVRGRDLNTIKADLIYEPHINRKLAKIINDASYELESCNDKGTLLKNIKSKSLKLLRRETKEFRKKGNEEIAELESMLSTLHQQLMLSTKITRAQANRKAEIKAEINKKRNLLNPPRARASHFRYRADELTTREFWTASYHRGNSATFINSLNIISDWTNPPPKDTISNNLLLR